jgi:tRNA G18 (ribose-2'-O)-methylase SpoU
VIHHIDRAGDPRLAPYADVGSHARLRERGLFVAEGRTVLRRLVEAGRFAIESVALSPAAHADLGDLIPQLSCAVYVCAPEILEAVTGFDFHRGCVALAKRPAEVASVARFAAATRVLAVEGVGNPDNIGGLFRVAQAFGVDGIVIAPSTADPFYRKAIRTSMGAVLHVPFVRAAAWPESIGDLQERGFRVAALTPQGTARDIVAFARDLPADARVVLLVGAEGPGLTSAALSVSTDLVRIPIDAAVDSLNVTVAAGIALAFLRKR